MRELTTSGGQTVGGPALVAALSLLSHTVNSEYSPDKALELAADSARRLLNVDSSALFVGTDDGEGLELAAGQNLAAGLSDRIKPVASRSMRSSAPVIFASLSSHDVKSYGELCGAGICALACLPLRVGDRSLGALIVVNGCEREFPSVDMELLTAIANLAALAVWKSRSYRASLLTEPSGSAVSAEQAELMEMTNRKIREFSALNRVSEAVVSTIDLAKLLQVTLEQAMATVGAGVGSILLLDEETKSLSIHASKGVPTERVLKTAVPVGKGIAGWVAQHGQAVLINDPASDPRFRLVAVRSDITSAMSVPLKTREKTVGVLNVSTVMPNRIFGERDLELLGALANQMASAIDNARLYDRLHRRSVQLSTLLGVARAITSTLEITKVQHLLADQLCKLERVDICALLMFDEKAGRFRLGHGRGLKKHRKKHAYLDLAQPVAQSAVKKGKLITIPDLSSDARLRISEVVKSEGIVSGAALPLKVKNHIVGVACIFSREPRQFSAREIDLLNAMSELAGIAVENARVYQHQYKIAHLLQKHLTPTTLDTQSFDTLGMEVGHKYVPSHDVGGDYYDFINVGPGKLGLVMADVAGSSVSAAVYTSMGKYVLRAYARDHSSPAEVLGRVNRIIYEDTEPELFISMLYGVFDLKRMIFRFASAGHEPALLYRADEQEFQVLRAPGILLGILPESDFDERDVQVRPGDILAFFTDGLAETSLDGKPFGVESIKETIASCALQPAQAIADNLYERLSQFADNRIVDDVGIVIVRVR